MHLLSTRAAGLVDDEGRGVVRLAQTPGEIVVLSAADSTLALLADTAAALPAGFPSVRLANLMALRQPASVDLYVDEVLQHARAVVVDHLGNAADWAYLVEQAGRTARRRGQWLALFSGDFGEDPQLLARSTAAADDCRLLWRCLRDGGPAQAEAFFALIAHAAFGRGERPAPPEPLPCALPYVPRDAAAWPARPAGAPVALLVFYRAHLQSGNTAVFDAQLAALAAAGLEPLALAVDTLKNAESLALLRALAARHAVDVVLNATAFALGGAGAGFEPLAGDAPVLQLLLAGSTRERWAEDPHGLAPRDLAMQVVLPEVDGRIATRAISFKGVAWRCERTEIDVVRYQPEPGRMAFVAELAWRWCRLRHVPPADQRLALVLANYPNDDARLANGVGLDTPASTRLILRALHEAGYGVGALPPDSEALMQTLAAGVTNDIEANDARPAAQSLALADYRAEFERLPAVCRDAVLALWGAPEADPMQRAGRFMIPGLRLGRVFVGIQPARSRGPDLLARYHDADLVPPHAYLAFYFWLRRHWAADAVVHVGKHGNLEWLPGKSVALGEACWPDLLLGPMPHLYPFIVNDPGEGCQAKRRTQAVIVDHLMPPLTRAESYGALLDIERTMDEYYEALALDPPRARRLRQVLLGQVIGAGLHRELGFDAPEDDGQREALLRRLDAFLCELKEAQIRDGLHVFGRSPAGRARRDTLRRWRVSSAARRRATPACCARWPPTWRWTSTRWRPTGPGPGPARARRCCCRWPTHPGATPATHANAWSCWPNACSKPTRCSLTRRPPTPPPGRRRRRCWPRCATCWRRGWTPAAPRRCASCCAAWPAASCRPAPAARRRAGAPTPCRPGATSTPSTHGPCPPSPPGPPGAPPPSAWSNAICRITARCRPRSACRSGARARCARAAKTWPRLWRCSARGPSGPPAAAVCSTSSCCRWRCSAGRASTSRCASRVSSATPSRT